MRHYSLLQWEKIRSNACFKNSQTLSKTLKFQYMTLLRDIHYETGWLAWCDEIMPLLK
ncbi:MAG: hypothetical protein KME18_28185 [Phormidium tanganyikae FI6-MK23]|nr:hypothetical protein [Phormidium tanganyikae FI6-MK23]